MKASLKQNRARELVTNLRRSIEALAPYATHRRECEAPRGSRFVCTCGLAERMAAAMRLCAPSAPPTHSQPRRDG